ncbi:flagellar hook-associated protein FlgK [Pseudomonas saudimassiliensis]|uniref:Flagellar hook-associated protein 1 n=1 Tax=Pseudomonas saudimassiliensis TaxID=1461581 RepID=A0A078MG04_9PSED|nr:flagellar hook-associated protein FlgK [Pseudomonas saudimassiliensis]CEA06248.1 flagellar hook-associated protein FlgK [Pseudomonas saudimassiliensis]CEF27673.1 flagellar hook-associated protein FlgK [Pseudomonas saudimassiliensis]
MADLFNIGLSGLRAAQTNLSVTGQNITNVNTPGYSRQTALQTANPPGYTGAGYMGTGTKVVDVQRIYNQFLTNQVRSTTSAAAEVAAYNTQIEELNSTLSSTASGITTGMQNYFDALQTAIEDPASLPARQLFLSEAQGLAGRFNSVHQQLDTQNRFLNQQMTGITEQVSRLAQSVAGFNEAISKAAANGAMPNDLLDARDEAIRQLSEYVGVTVVAQDDNSVNLFIGSGQPLVVGKEASALRAAPGRADPGRLDIQLVSGGTAQDVTSLIHGGELGGLLNYRGDVLDLAFNALGRMSLSIANEFNQQLGKGLDLNGQVGTDLFGDINGPEYLEQRSRGREGNRSEATLDVRIGDTSALTTSDYELTFTSDTEFTVRRAGDGRVLGHFDLTAEEGQPGHAVFDGLDLSRGGEGKGFNAGPYREGDRYLLTPTRSAAKDLTVDMTDPRKLAFAVAGATSAGAGNTGTGTLSPPALTTPARLDLAALKDVSVSFSYGADGVLSFTVDGNDAVAVEEFEVGKPFKVTIEGQEFSMTLSGLPKAGDTFAIDFSTGIADNRNALALSELQNRAVLAKGENARGFSLLDGYGDLVQKVATFTAQSRTEAQANQSMLVQATNNRNSVSAVNLDEEAANLIQFEQYYNASAQIIQVARTVFDTLISTMR